MRRIKSSRLMGKNVLLLGSFYFVIRYSFLDATTEILHHCSTIVAGEAKYTREQHMKISEPSRENLSHIDYWGKVWNCFVYNCRWRHVGVMRYGQVLGVFSNPISSPDLEMEAQVLAIILSNNVSWGRTWIWPDCKCMDKRQLWRDLTFQ